MTAISNVGVLYNLAVQKHLKNLILLHVLVLVTSGVSAQQKINGKVLSEDNFPLSGATITVKGSNIAITSLNDGSFSLTAKGGDVLEISFVGFRTRELRLGNETSLRIVLHAT